MRLSIFFILAVLSAALLLPMSASATSRAPQRAVAPRKCPNSALLPSPTNLAAIDSATRCLINQVRSAHRLHPLHPNSSLRVVASSQATDMVLGDYFGDDSIAGQTPLQRILQTGYSPGSTAVSLAQNIAWGTGKAASPAGVLAAWMHSTPHRLAILSPGFQDIGVGVDPAAPTALAGGRRGATYTVEFALRISAQIARR